MRNTNKKGFTIVELVIVVAVIAILAAVLIPTFSGIIAKANESADIQAVRQMNVALAVDGAVAPTTQGNLFNVLAEAGIKAKNYKPLYDGRYFYWDKELNQVLYVDAENNVLFPENVTPSNKWYSLSGEINTAGAVINVENIDLTAATISLNISNAADFVKAAEFISEKASNLGNKTVEIVLSADINLMGADVNFTQHATQSTDVVFKSNDGTQKTISGLYISDAHATSGNDANGNASNTYGHSLFNYIGNLTVENVAIADSTIGGTEASQSGFFAGQVTGTASFTNVDVTNCDIYGLKKVGVLFGFGHGEVILNDVHISNCNVYTKDGEAGAVFGVVEVSKVATTENVATITNSSVTGCKVEIVAGSDVKTGSLGGASYKVVQNGESEWRVATAGIGFIAQTIQDPEIELDNVNGKGRLYDYINTLDEFAAVKGSK